MCTDSRAAIQIKNGKFKEGIYDIQNIIALHSNLRGWKQKFKGVSTKYLANYSYWFKWLEFFKGEKRALKSEQFLINAHSSHNNDRIKDFQGSGLIYI